MIEICRIAGVLISPPSTSASVCIFKRMDVTYYCLINSWALSLFGISSATQGFIRFLSGLDVWMEDLAWGSVSNLGSIFLV